MILPPLQRGTLVQRYKRFLADIKLPDGNTITVHCPNSGSMLYCSDPGSTVMLSFSDNPKRKYAYTWELVLVNDVWVGINTMVPNSLVYEAIVESKVPALSGYKSIKREVRYGQNSRIDLLLSDDENKCYVEVKNVTLAQDNIARFPDAVTARGTKHLNELISMVEQGSRSVMFYLVQRKDTTLFQPAQSIDPVYAETLQKAVQKGVEIMVYQADVTPEKITLGPPIPYQLT